MNFVRCQRGDGSHYGTSGQCRKGREVDPLKRLTRTRAGALQRMLDGNKKNNLGNGVQKVKGDLRELDKISQLGGFPRPIGKVLDENNVAIVARRTHRPWEELNLPVGSLNPYRVDRPMQMFMTHQFSGDKSFPDIDMAVNPTLIRADSLLKPAYDKYNKEFFGGKLPDTNLFVAPSMRSAMGLSIHWTDDDDKMIYSLIAMSFPHLRNATEESIHSVLLHEMIHIRDFSLGRPGEHDGFFNNKMKEIDRKWKRETSGIYADDLTFAPYQLSKTKRNPAGSIAKERDFPEISRRRAKTLIKNSSNDGIFNIIQEDPWKGLVPS